MLALQALLLQLLLQTPVVMLAAQFLVVPPLMLVMIMAHYIVVGVIYCWCWLYSQGKMMVDFVKVSAWQVFFSAQVRIHTFCTKLSTLQITYVSCFNVRSSRYP